MQWINEPPCHSMNLEQSDLVAGKLALSGPGRSERMAGGFVAAVGATFATTAMRFLRTPIPVPMPFKLIPVAIGLVGSGVGAAGAAAATGSISVLFERGKGVTFRWRILPLRARELFIPADEIAALDISRTVHTSKDSVGFSTEHFRYQLNVVRKTGEAVPFESFGLHTQARLRKEQIEAVMRPVEPPVESKPTRTRKKAPPRKKAPARKKTSARETSRAPRTR